MAYATQADIITIYSEDALFVADRDGDGMVDADAVTRALDMASSEIDSFLGVRYDVPLASAPEVIKQIAVDFAIYRLALSSDVLSEEHRQRYKDGKEHLIRFGEGKAYLDLPAEPLGEGETPLPDGPQPIVSGGPEKLFTREKTRDL
ncbi:gp436 family protein [Profundibacter sp.]